MKNSGRMNSTIKNSEDRNTNTAHVDIRGTKSEAEAQRYEVDKEGAQPRGPRHY